MSRSLPALAVHTGAVGHHCEEQAVGEKLFGKPDDPYVLGEKAQLEFDIKALEKNKQYAAQLKTRVQPPATCKRHVPA